MTKARPATDVAPLTAEEEAVMRALARAIIVIPRVLDADLSRDARLGANEYGVLMHLSEADGHYLRMNELAAAVALSLSGVTRIVSRLESEGLVRRERCGTDGRGAWAVLTEAGMQRLREAWPAHLASVRRHIMDHLGAIDLAALADALNRIAPCAAHLDTTCPTAPSPSN